MTSLNRRKLFHGLMFTVSFGIAEPSLAGVVGGDLPARPGEDGAGIGYGFLMDLVNGQDPAVETWSGSVGSKAWSDSVNLPGPLGIPLGWTHTSVWGNIRLEADARVQLSLAPDNSDLVPAFTLWQGADNHGANWHTYEQDQVPFWVDADGFSYLRHVTTGPGPYQGDATMSLFLPAGEYTVALGGNDNITEGHPAAYRFTVAASPVPLPGAAYLLGSALLGFTAWGRKRPHALKTSV
jgi:hypothetical protein